MWICRHVPFSIIFCISTVTRRANINMFSKESMKMPALPYTHNIFANYESILSGPRQANLVLIAYASSEGSGEPAHPRSLARTSAARSYKQ